MNDLKIGSISEWENPSEGTMEKVLEEIEVVLSKYYKEDWEYNYDVEDGWVDLKLQIPSDKYEES